MSRWTPRLRRAVAVEDGSIAQAGGAWGLNDQGQLGDSTTTTRGAPVQIATLTGATLLAAGDRHSLAVRSDATVAAWGSNRSGELRDGTTTSRSAPVTVSGLSNVAGGDDYLCVRQPVPVEDGSRSRFDHNVYL